jgi:LPS O-antigen subunit length determinant protein (WzzB/FepE family)
MEDTIPVDNFMFGGILAFMFLMALWPIIIRHISYKDYIRQRENLRALKKRVDKKKVIVDEMAATKLTMDRLLSNDHYPEWQEKREQFDQLYGKFQELCE